MALTNMDLLLPSIGHLLAAWQPAMQRFHAHLERLNPRLRYLLPPALPRYVRFGLFQSVQQRILVPDCGAGLPRLGQRLRAEGFELPDLDTLIAAWLATLDELLGERLSGEAREEWVRLYRILRPAFSGAISAV